MKSKKLFIHFLEKLLLILDSSKQNLVKYSLKIYIYLYFKINGILLSADKMFKIYKILIFHLYL